MMVRYSALYKKNQGFSLLELLLSMTVMFGLMTAATVVINDTFNDSIDRKVAREMRQLQTAAEQYVALNLERIIANNIPVLNTTEELDINDLINNGFLPTGYEARNSYRQQLRVLIRNAAENTVNGDVVEVIAFSDGRRIEDKRLFNAALNGQEGLGVISDLDISTTCCNGNIQSLSGDWSIALNDIDAALRPTSPNDSGGYMASYGLVSNRNQLSQDYLFRDLVPGQPERNRMLTNLDLVENDIVNAGIIVADNMNVAGGLILEGVESDGSISPYVLSVRDSYDTGSLQARFGADETKGNVIINGEDNLNVDFEVLGNFIMPVDKSVTAPRIVTDEISVTGVSLFGTLNNPNGALTAGDVTATSVTFNDSVTTETLQAANVSNVATIEASSATAVNVNVSTSGGFSISPSASIDVANNILIRGDSTIQNLETGVEARIQNLDRTNCGASCP